MDLNDTPEQAQYRAQIRAWLDEHKSAAPVLDGDAVRRVASADTFVAYSPELEDLILPQSEGIKAAMDQLLRF